MDILGQSGAGDWVESIVVLVIIGLSMFGSVAKWFIKKINDAKEEKAAGTAKRPSPTTMQPRQPAHPTARPLQPGSPRRVPQPPTPPRLRPQLQPARPIAKRPVRQPQAPARRSTRPSTAMPPVAQPFGVPLPSERVARRAAQATPPPASQPSPKRAPKPSRRKSEAQTSVPVAQRHLELSKSLQHPRTEAPEIQHEPATPDPVHRPTRDDLRRAIILSEIFRPPVGMRDPSEQF